MKQLINRNFFSFVNRETQRFLALYKQTVMPGLISTALYILVFGAALGERIDRKDLGGSYIVYIIPGLIMMAVINHAYQNSSSSLMQAKFLKFLDDILVTPLSGIEIAFGYIIGGILRGVITGVSIILMCFIITPELSINNYLGTILYIILVSWTFSSIGVIVGIFAKSWDHIGVFTTFIFMPLTMLGGVFWSVKWLPDPWNYISQLNPVYWMVNGLRYCMLYDSSNKEAYQDFSFGLSLIICLLFCLFFSTIASYLVTKGYRIKS